ncbi:hypothetical protein B2J88_36280 [Rhodococcus sp. SRB_17]|uniref:hypothetical protein n=1 Tax=Acidovorax sp. SRB_24 TaxID=1962700 RepID=UPI00145FBB9E|nr:hypothetical protein [Acidovorax sp. SRB_24]NMM89734.1 hypothetical protein [Rhodococcus sp. SRB_17]
MKPTATIALAAALIGSAAALGIWGGQRSAHSVVPAAAYLSKTTTNSAKAAIPHIALPPALEDQPQEEVVAPKSSAVANEPTDIIPGGAVSGNAVDRMWETTASQAWQVRATPITPPNWFITGVVQRGEKTQIIVQFDGEPAPRFLKIGDVLPGGGKLAWVRPDAIGIITPNRKRIGIPVLSDSSIPAPLHSTRPSKDASASAR